MSRLGYNLKQAFVQIHRNRGMSTASVFAITAMMLILGLFFVITVNVNLFTEVVKEDYDHVEIFLDDATTAEQAQVIMEKLGNIKNVSDVSYRSKEDAMKIMKQRWGDSAYLLDSLGENPLPNSVVVTVGTIKAANKVTSYAAKLDGVEDVTYYKETVEKLMADAEPDLFDSETRCDLELNSDEVTADLAEEMKLLAPFGCGNEMPLIRVSLRPCDVRSMGSKMQYRRFSGQLANGRNVACVIFSNAERFDAMLAEGRPVSVIGTLENQSWNDKKYLQINVADAEEQVQK